MDLSLSANKRYQKAHADAEELTSVADAVDGSATQNTASPPQQQENNHDDNDDYLTPSRPNRHQDDASHTSSARKPSHHRSSPARLDDRRESMLQIAVAEDLTEEAVEQADMHSPPAVSVEPEPDADTIPGMTSRYRAFVFFMFVTTQAFTNFDSGSVGAVIGEKGPMSKDFGTSGATDGILASIAYLGNAIGGAMCSYLFRRHHAKRVLTVSLTVHFAFSLAFAAAPHVGLAIVARLIVGITQAFVVVYTPVWVDEFAPAAHATTWMALAQAGVPIGIMLGYLTAGLVQANTDASWRVAFYVKAFVLLPIIAVFYYLKKFALQAHERTVKDKQDGFSRQFAEIKVLATNKLYMATVSSLCSLYFVVTGLQLWITAYLQLPPISADLNAIVGAFGVTSATGPVLGVVLGGVVLDRIGGYQAHVDRAAMFGTTCGVLAFVFAVVTLLLSDFWSIIATVWMLLFLGGAVVPTATGMMMSCVPRDMRNLGSSFAAMTFNLFGYFLGPFLCGAIADVADLRWGFRIVMLWSVVAVVSMGYAAVIARRMAREAKHDPVSPSDAPVAPRHTVGGHHPFGDNSSLPGVDADGVFVANASFDEVPRQMSGFGLGMGVLENMRVRNNTFTPSMASVYRVAGSGHVGPPTPKGNVSPVVMGTPSGAGATMTTVPSDTGATLTPHFDTNTNPPDDICDDFSDPGADGLDRTM
eukprot:PhM_4_TR9081/c0_g1_i4/m.92502